MNLQKLYWPLFTLALSAWMIGIYVHLYVYSLPNMDTWCYFAPAQLANYPGDLSMPLLGEFRGADEVWAIHWPGALWAYTLFMPWLPPSPLVYTSLIILLVLLTGLLTGWLTYGVTHNRWVAACACFSFLFARFSFQAQHMARSELFASLVFLLLVLLVIHFLRTGKARLGQLCLLTFLAFAAVTSSHALIAILGLLLTSLFLWIVLQKFSIAPRTGFPGLAVFLAGSAGCLLGLAALALWFSQPFALDQFKAHAAANLPTSYGAYFARVFLPGLFVSFPFCGLELPFMLVASVVLSFSYVVYRVATKGRLKSNHPTDSGEVQDSQECDEAQRLLLVTIMACAFISSFLLTNLFHNLVYYPIVIAIFWGGTFYLAKRIYWNAAIFSVCAILLLAATGVHLGTRTIRFFQAGQPNFRASISQFYDRLPKNRPLLIPVEMAEEAIIRRDSRAKISYLPYSNPEEIALDYLQKLEQEQIEPGTIWVDNKMRKNIRRQKFVLFDRVINPDDWVEIDSDAIRIQARLEGSYWGYDFVAYEYRPARK